MRRSTTGLIVILNLKLLAAPLLADAQQAGKLPRIGYLSFFSPNPYDEVFRQGLHDLGYVEGQNIAIEYRFTEGNFERLQEFAAELVRLKVDVIVTTTGESTRVVQKITSTVPIVMVASGDAVGQGLIVSLAHPGGNVTGFTVISPDLGGKRLELLKQALPEISRVGVLWCPGDPVNDQLWREVQAASWSLGVKLQSLEVREFGDLEAEFAAAIREHTEALVISDCPPFFIPPKRTVDLAVESRLPAVYPFGFFVDAGGLMAYGPSISDLFRRAAIYVDKVLKGARPADLPVEQPTKFELAINRQTAEALGLTIPPSLLFQADRVIR